MNTIALQLPPKEQRYSNTKVITEKLKLRNIRTENNPKLPSCLCPFSAALCYTAGPSSPCDSCRVCSAHAPPHASVREKWWVKDTVSLLESQKHSLSLLSLQSSTAAHNEPARKKRGGKVERRNKSEWLSEWVMAWPSFSPKTLYWAGFLWPSLPSLPRKCWVA